MNRRVSETLQKSCIVVGACLAVGAATADANAWVFDTSERASETTSSGSASLSSALESRSVSAGGSAATAVDSRWGDRQASEPGALKSTTAGFRIVFS